MSELDDFLDSVRGDGLPEPEHEERVLNRIMAATASPTDGAHDPASSLGGRAEPALSAGAGGGGILTKLLLLSGVVVGAGLVATASLDGPWDRAESPVEQAAQGTSANRSEARPQSDARESQPAGSEASDDRQPLEASFPEPSPPAASDEAEEKETVDSVDQGERASVERELELLRRAQAQFRAGDARGALRTLKQNHPLDRALSEERLALEILSSCKLNMNVQEALRDFSERFPSSVHADALTRNCSRASQK